MGEGAMQRPGVDVRMLPLGVRSHAAFAQSLQLAVLIITAPESATQAHPSAARA